MPHSPYRLLIVDDDQLALQALSRYFSNAEDFVVVATVSSGEQALAELRQGPVNVVLADIHMPNMNGLALLDEIMALPSPPVFIAITALDNDEILMKVLGNGGSGYILKSQTPDSVIQSVRDAVSGGLVVSPNAMQHLISKIPSAQSETTRPMTLLEKLTSPSSQLLPADQETLRLLCRGKSNMEIAQEMHYSESATKKRVSKLIHQFGASSRLDLVVALLNPDE